MRNLDRFYKRLKKDIMSETRGMTFGDAIKAYVEAYKKDITNTPNAVLNLPKKSRKFLLNPSSDHDGEFLMVEICDVFPISSHDNKPSFAVRVDILSDYLSVYQSGSVRIISFDHSLCSWRVTGLL